MRETTDAYYHVYAIEQFQNFIKSVKCEKFAAVLNRVLDLYINERIVNNAGYYRTYLSQNQFDLIKDHTTTLLKDIRPDALALTEILPYHNRLLGPFGNEDLQIYNRFTNTILNVPHVRERASWWKLNYTNHDAK